MTEDDTFNALIRSSVSVVDEEMLKCFNVPNYSTPIRPDTYEIEIEGDIDISLFAVVLIAHRWRKESYLKHTAIVFRFVDETTTSQ